MNIIRSEDRFCVSCMEEHTVDTIQREESEEFKGEEVVFVATYDYCTNTDELLETEEFIRANNLAVKDAYREKVGLLTSEEIIRIRDKYGISQKDFSKILNWGEATITRYENHQVQDRAHDDILRKIDSDPKWLLEMLNRSKVMLSQKAFNKYCERAQVQFNSLKNSYLVDTINAEYASLKSTEFTGCNELKLDKAVEVINYIAQRVPDLYKVKLMKLLWYCDIYHFKNHGRSITGLAYKVLKMGAVPFGHEYIIKLDGVNYDVVEYNDIAYRFKVVPDFEIRSLTEEEIDTLETIISELGALSTQEIVQKMHEEEAYKEVQYNEFIPYFYCKKLSIS